MKFPLNPLAADRHLIPMLRQRQVAAPKSQLIVQGESKLDAETLLKHGTDFAKALQESGLIAGDRVAVQLNNRIEFLSVFTGCALLGLILVPINTASRGSQLAYYLRNSRAKVFITEPTLIANLVSANEASEESIKGLEMIWSLDSFDQRSNLIKIKDFAEVKRAEKIQESKADATLPAMIMYTSGTSGPSKGVMCSHAQLFWWGLHSIKNIGINEKDVLYTCLPLFHVNALNTFYQALMCGGKIVLGGKFSVKHFYEELAKTEATITYLLGAMIPMLLSRNPDASENAHKVRTALAPGASAQHYQSFESRTGIKMLDGYGSTETNFVICTPRNERRPGSMGKVVEGFDAKVVDLLDNEVPNGMPGELILRNSNPFAFSLGYFEMPEKTTEAWRNLWFHTGDRVVRDEEGYFRFLDRMKDSIRRRGENISSFEVEQVVGAHHSIAEIAAYAVPSDLAEDEVMCALVLKEGVAYEPLEIIKWAEVRLPYFAVPKYLRVMKELPKTENGKVQKYKLREQGKTRDTWDLSTTGHVVKR